MPIARAYFASAGIEAATVHQASDDHLVARAFRDMSEESERVRLLRCLYAVAAADGNISATEDNEIFEVAAALGIRRLDVVAPSHRIQSASWIDEVASERELIRYDRATLSQPMGESQHGRTKESSKSSKESLTEAGEEEQEEGRSEEDGQEEGEQKESDAEGDEEESQQEKDDAKSAKKAGKKKVAKKKAGKKKATKKRATPKESAKDDSKVGRYQD